MGTIRHLGIRASELRDVHGPWPSPWDGALPAPPRTRVWRVVSRDWNAALDPNPASAAQMTAPSNSRSFLTGQC
jgi:hypothetical protein